MLRPVRTTPSANDFPQWAREAASAINNLPALYPGLARWTRYAVDFADFAAAGTSASAELLSLPAGWCIHNVLLKHSEEFSGGAISAYTLSVGITGTPDKYLAAFDVFQAPGATVFSFGTTQGLESMGAATSIKVAAVSTSANLDQADQGAAVIWVRTSGPGEVT